MRADQSEENLSIKKTTRGTISNSRHRRAEARRQPPGRACSRRRPLPLRPPTQPGQSTSRPDEEEPEMEEIKDTSRLKELDIRIPSQFLDDLRRVNNPSPKSDTLHIPIALPMETAPSCRKCSTARAWSRSSPWSMADASESTSDELDRACRLPIRAERRRAFSLIREKIEARRDQKIECKADQE